MLKYEESLLCNKKKKLTAAQSLNKPLLENDIVAIQDILLSPGIHCINNNKYSSSLIIDIVFPLLNHYSHPGCLSKSKTTIAIENCYQTLDDLHFLQEPFDFEEFFLNYFPYDFFWINLTVELFLQDWFLPFYETLYELNIEQDIPIILTIN